MVNDAELHAEEDKKEREKAEARNEADNLIYTTEKSLTDYGDKITEDDRKNIETAVEELRNALKLENTEDIKSKSENLKQASYKLAEEVYKAASQSGQAAEGADSPGAEETEEAAATQPEEQEGSEEKGNVEDVDYEVVDDDDSKK